MTVISKLYSLPEFLQLPQIEKSPAWDLIEGQFVQKLMPTPHHSILRKRLVQRSIRLAQTTKHSQSYAVFLAVTLLFLTSLSFTKIGFR